VTSCGLVSRKMCFWDFVGGGIREAEACRMDGTY
jgi:hypothetical protein